MQDFKIIIRMATDRGHVFTQENFPIPLVFERVGVDGEVYLSQDSDSILVDEKDSSRNAPLQKALKTCSRNIIKFTVNEEEANSWFTLAPHCQSIDIQYTKIGETRRFTTDLSIEAEGAVHRVFDRIECEVEDSDDTSLKIVSLSFKSDLNYSKSGSYEPLISEEYSELRLAHSIKSFEKVTGKISSITDSGGNLQVTTIQDHGYNVADTFNCILMNSNASYSNIPVVATVISANAFTLPISFSTTTGEGFWGTWIRRDEVLRREKEEVDSEDNEQNIKLVRKNTTIRFYKSLQLYLSGSELDIIQHLNALNSVYLVDSSGATKAIERAEIDDFEHVEGFEDYYFVKLNFINDVAQE